MGPCSVIRICLALLGSVAGVILFGMGIGYYRIDNDLAKILADVGIPQTGTAVLIMGILIFVLSLLSLLSSLRNTIIIKILYCGILFTILTIFIVIAVMVFLKRREFLNETVKMYDRLWRERKTFSGGKIIDSINKYLECCGRHSYTDYGENLPRSCCAEDVKVCSQYNAFRIGCRPAMNNFVASKSDGIGFIALGTAVLLGLIAFSAFSGVQKNVSHR